MDKYAVITLIGEGSFGRVYKAKRKSNDGTVAIKIITKRGRSNKELKNLRRECEIQKHLNHPNIIGMKESFETKNEIFVVTEFAQTDLHRFLAKCGSIDEEKAQKMCSQLVSALYYLHSHRILHRDLKPQNVLLVSDETVKLCDFGLARNMTMGTHVLTSIKGTPLYMAPELLMGRSYDHQVDLWSLGCIVYETISGQPPFSTTSYLHLLRLIQHEEVKWPSCLTSSCASFLQGLLEKDPSLRLNWTQILCHPFVEGRLTILKDDSIDKTYIEPRVDNKSSSGSKKGTNKLQLSKNLDSFDKNLSDLNLTDRSGADNVSTSKDSTKAILQSDIENIETDAEDLENRLNIPFSEPTPFRDEGANQKMEEITENPNLTKTKSSLSAEQSDILDGKKQKVKTALSGNKSNLKKGETSEKPQTSSRNKDLEKRKLSQNLDNFSLRMGQNTEVCETGKKIAENNSSEKKKTTKSSSGDDKPVLENTPPCMLPGWDSCDESTSPPIENDEWLAFLKRSMQEILDGELDSLKQQNLVSIIVAPLRNRRACPKVIESVAQLLSLPFALDGPENVMETIKNVYIEAKLVPNLVYASKLITNPQPSTLESSTSSPMTSSLNKTFRPLSELMPEEIQTISSLYELVCHLVHLNERFLVQFCEAVAILKAYEMLINFLTHDYSNTNSIRISNCVVGLLCCVIRELPENAEIVERIVFNQRLDLVTLIKNKSQLMRLRICMLFRLLGRFSCRSLQSIWSTEMREAMESLMDDSNEDIRTEAEFTLDELKQFSFYN